eukprot:3327387-Prorocentrum_lima.AAC.1
MPSPKRAIDSKRTTTRSFQVRRMTLWLWQMIVGRWFCHHGFRHWESGLSCRGWHASALPIEGPTSMH